MDNGSNKIEQIEALKNGEGIQYLLDEAYKIFGNPLLMHDLDFRAIAHTENHVTDDPLWNEFVTNGGHYEETRAFLRDEALIDIAASAKTIAILSSENLKNDRLMGKVYNVNNILVAIVDIVACYKPIEEDDPPAFDAFCKVLSREISKSKFYKVYGETYQESLICKLVNVDIKDKKLYQAHVEIVYSGLKSKLYLAVVDITHIDPRHTKLSHYRDLLRKRQPEYKYAVYSNYILIIITTDDPVLDVKKDLGRMERFFHRNNIYAGISSCFENLFEMHKYYQEALSALNNGLGMTSQRIFLYEQFK